MTPTISFWHLQTRIEQFNRGVQLKEIIDVLDIFQEAVWVLFAQEPRDGWRDSTNEEEEHKGWKNFLSDRSYRSYNTYDYVICLAQRKKEEDRKTY